MYAESFIFSRCVRYNVAAPYKCSVYNLWVYTYVLHNISLQFHIHVLHSMLYIQPLFPYIIPPLQCNHSVALRSYFHQLTTPPTKVGWIGSGCSVATEPTADLTHYYNITQVMKTSHYMMCKSTASSCFIGFMCQFLTRAGE